MKPREIYNAVLKVNGEVIGYAHGIIHVGVEDIHNVDPMLLALFLQQDEEISRQLKERFHDIESKVMGGLGVPKETLLSSSREGSIDDGTEGERLKSREGLDADSCSDYGFHRDALNSPPPEFPKVVACVACSDPTVDRGDPRGILCPRCTRFFDSLKMPTEGIIE